MKEITIKLTAGEVESLSNVFNYLKDDEQKHYSELMDSGYEEALGSHIYHDVIVLDSVLKRAVGKTTYVDSSHGALEIDETGAVVRQLIDCPPGTCDNCIDGYVWFDLKENRRFYSRDCFSHGFDILDLGGRTAGGESFPPDAEFRKNIAEEKHEKENI